MDFSGKRVLVMGLGLQGGGAGVARFFAERKAKVTVTDLKTEKELAPSLASLANLAISYILGCHRKEDFKKADLIIRNPDVPKDSPYLIAARKNGIPVEMDESLFLRLCPRRENVIGITGTRGKTTTTHLLGTILKKAGCHTLLGGNLLGVATLSLLDQITSKTMVVLELSSWQLQGLGWDKESPHIAVVTNIYPDHLNRYQNMEEYINDKKIIFQYQKRDDFLVLNAENKITKSFGQKAQSRIVWFSKSDIIHRGVLDLKLKGGHNLENLAAAYAVAKILKIDDQTIKEAMSSFTGVPYRLEEIATINGVTYVNDTTSTTPIACQMALRAYEDRPIILIAGGASKNLSLTDLGREIDQKAKAVILLEGTAASELEKAIEEKKKIKGRFNDLAKAVLAAKDSAKDGDIVLLSPGCTSFGMFKNEFNRGEKFTYLVKSLNEKKRS